MVGHIIVALIYAASVRSVPQRLIQGFSCGMVGQYIAGPAGIVVVIAALFIEKIDFFAVIWTFLFAAAATEAAFGFRVRRVFGFEPG